LKHWQPREEAILRNEPNSAPAFESHARPFAIAIKEDHASRLKRVADGGEIRRHRVALARFEANDGTQADTRLSSQDSLRKPQ
jgi:hypothetical protein